MTSLIRLLQNAFKKLMQDPLEGFTAELLDGSDITQWKIFIEGPKATPYEGGIFQLLMKFPEDYPMSPPVLRFLSDFWHPNVYEDGKVCISILHPPGEDEMSGELPGERWLPTQTVTTILLSVISMLNDPNISSPANVDASVEWRKNRESYTKRCQKLVEKANKELPPGIKIPHPDTDPEEKRKHVEKMRAEIQPVDFFEDSEHTEGSAEDEEDEEPEEEDEEDEEEEDKEEEKKQEDESEGEGERTEEKSEGKSKVSEETMDKGEEKKRHSSKVQDGEKKGKELALLEPSSTEELKGKDVKEKKRTVEETNDSTEMEDGAKGKLKEGKKSHAPGEEASASTSPAQPPEEEKMDKQEEEEEIEAKQEAMETDEMPKEKKKKQSKETTRASGCKCIVM